MGMAVLDDAQRQRRQSVYEFLDSTKPALARALRWCETAREMRRIDGDMKEARLLLHDSLCCVQDYASIYRTWIADEYGDYWCAYLAFELRHGDARRMRTVAARAVKACPRDSSLRDIVELRLSDAGEQRRRHRLGLVRGAKKWLSNVEQSGRFSSLLSRPPRGYQQAAAPLAVIDCCLGSRLD